MDKKRIRVSLYLEGELKEIEHIFMETVAKKSLAGMFLKNLLLFILEKKGKDEAERIIYKVARGNVEVLKELFCSSRLGINSSKKGEDLLKDENADQPMDISKFIL